MRGFARILLAAILISTACAPAPPVVSATAPLPLAPSLSASAVPTPAVVPPAARIETTADGFMRLLALRDAAWRAGDVDAAVALVAADAPPGFREHERQLAVLAKQGAPIMPTRGPLVQTREIGSLRMAVVVELDPEGRTRQIRYFAVGPLEQLKLTEPASAELGERTTVRDEGFDVRAYPIDADPCAAALALAKQGLLALIAQLGDAYRPQARISYECLPTVQPELPPLASAFTRNTAITLLTSQSTVVGSGPGSDWSRIVVTHELAHALLFQRGTGPFVLSEGLPLWLTDDRRQPELDRLVRANTIWTLDHLIAGPNDDSEFFAGYAQASSFVRFLAATYGGAAVISAWENGRLVTFAAAFSRGFGTTPEAAYQAWRASLTR